MNKGKSYTPKYFKGQKKNKNNKAFNYAEYIGYPTLTEWVYPIYRCIQTELETKTGDIGGTCFHIGRDLFMTANHVFDPHEKYNLYQIGFLNQVNKARVERYDIIILEQFKDADVAIIQCTDIFKPQLKPKPFHWHHAELLYFQIVRSMGYPKGYDQDKGFTLARAFQGTKIGNRYYENDIVKAKCYEISIHWLKGISGSCLLDANYHIHGIITGNSPEEGYVFKESEILSTTSSKPSIRVDRMETMYIGLAVDKVEIFKLYSNTLGCTIHDYLKSEGLHKCKCI